MKRILCAVIIAGIVAACASNARRTVPVAPVAAPQASLRVTDSVFFKASPELQKSIDELTASLQQFAVKVANDPQIRLAAMKAASGFVATAQEVLAEQSTALQEALKTASQRISEMQAAQRSKTRVP